MDIILAQQILIGVGVRLKWGEHVYTFRGEIGEGNMSVLVNSLGLLVMEESGDDYSGGVQSL